YGDGGFVLTGLPTSLTEDLKNVISVPVSPRDLSSYTGDFPGFKFGFILRRPLACGVDYDRNQVYVYDYHIRGLILLDNWNTSAIKDAINISNVHVGISQEYV
ncbi:hypothetical protein MAR_027601, partial [Mya arenaria]